MQHIAVVGTLWSIPSMFPFCDWITFLCVLDNMDVGNDRDLVAVIIVVQSTLLSEGYNCVCLWGLISAACWSCALVRFVFKGFCCWSKNNWILLDKRLWRSLEPRAKWGPQLFQTQLDHDQLSLDWVLINQSFFFFLFTPQDRNRIPLCAVHDKFMI